MPALVVPNTQGQEVVPILVLGGQDTPGQVGLIMRGLVVVLILAPVALHTMVLAAAHTQDLVGLVIQGLVGPAMPARVGVHIQAPAAAVVAREFVASATLRQT